MSETMTPEVEYANYEGELKRRSQFREVWRRLRRNKLAMVGMVIVVFLVFVAVFANFLAPYDPSAQNISDRLMYPCWAHPMGTDNMGRDILSRVIYGGRVSLLCSLMSIVFSLIAGGILGCIAGFFGGKVDSVIMRLMDILMAIPQLLMAVAVSAMLGTGVVTTAVAIAVSGVAPTARMIRASILTVRDQEYILAAQATGSGSFRTIMKHVLPNILSPVIVDTSLRVGASIMAISSLSFIGLGVQAPTPEWGSMLNDGLDYIRDFWPLVTFPGIAIALTLFGFNLFGDGLRDALDPRLKQ
ncbi:MAG: ABC transporter permease [Oscillospiraceae bacterium]|nr:ABC transporter permease [Oscillospiraceae bacterium]